MDPRKNRKKDPPKALLPPRGKRERRLLEDLLAADDLLRAVEATCLNFGQYLLQRLGQLVQGRCSECGQRRGCVRNYVPRTCAECVAFDLGACAEMERFWPTAFEKAGLKPPKSAARRV